MRDDEMMTSFIRDQIAPLLANMVPGIIFFENALVDSRVEFRC